MSEVEYRPCGTCNLYTQEADSICKRCKAEANSERKGFGSSRCSPDDAATTAMCSEAEIAALRRRLLDESGITQDGIAEAIRGLKFALVMIASETYPMSRERIAGAISQLELIAAWIDAAK